MRSPTSWPTATISLVAILLVGAIVAGAEAPVEAAPQAAPIARIALVADPHLSPEPRYAAYIAHYRQVIAQVNRARVDGVLLAGDLAQSGSPRSWALVRQLSAGLTPRVWFIPGNHDVGNKPLPGKAATVTQARVARYEHVFGPGDYACDITPQVHLVAIDASLLGTHLPAAEGQWAFLARRLAQPQPGVTLLLSHYPPFTARPDEPDGYFNMMTSVRQRLLPLLHSGKVAAILSGHLHRPIDLMWSGIHLIGAPAVSFGLPPGHQAVGWTLVKVYADGRTTATLHYLPPDAPAPPAAAGPGPATQPSTALQPDPRVHIFYYDWYGAPPGEPSFRHWQQGGHQPPESLGAAFYPQLGPYSSGDRAVLRQHMQWIRQSGAGVLVLTWWGRDSYEDQHAAAVLAAAGQAGLKVAFHIEPYAGRSPASVVRDVRYLLGRFGGNPALYRLGGTQGRPMFYVFEALRHPAGAWAPALAELARDRPAPLMIAQTTDLTFIRTAGFAGGYAYDILPWFRHLDQCAARLAHLAPEFASTGKILIPSVGPGYDDGRAVHPGTVVPRAARSRDEGTGTTYTRQWQMVAGLPVPIISITSFNEWHEGTQIEPAVARHTPGYDYPAYLRGPLQYIHLTAEMVGRYEAVHPLTKALVASGREP